MVMPEKPLKSFVLFQVIKIMMLDESILMKDEFILIIMDWRMNFKKMMVKRTDTNSEFCACIENTSP